jgi:putative spermidine/putrescine transport system permease protein
MLRLFSLGVFTYLLLPMLVIVLFSFDGGNYFKFEDFEFSLKWYTNLFTESHWAEGIVNSLKVAIATVLLSVAISIPAALWLNKYRNGLVLSVVVSPIVIPGIIMGIGWIFFFNDIGFTNSLVNLIIAHTVLCTPYVVLMTTSSLNNYNESIAKSARLCGASNLQVFKDVQLPIMLPGILAGSALAFITSFDEFIVALLLSGHNSQTLPIIMWSYVTDIISPSVLSISVLITIVYAVIIYFGKANKTI